MVGHTDTVMEVEVRSTIKMFKINPNLFQTTVTAMTMVTVMAEKEKEGVRSCRCQIMMSNHYFLKVLNVNFCLLLKSVNTSLFALFSITCCW